MTSISATSEEELLIMSRMEIQEQEEYESLSSDAAVKEAQDNGGEVIFPSEFELQLDLDSEEAVQVFKNQLPVLEQFIKTKHWGISPSRSPGKYHVTLELQVPVQSNMERILLQACLGSDPKRELLSYQRVLKRDQHPTLFIEGGTKPKKEEELEKKILRAKEFEEVQLGDKGSSYDGETGTVIAIGTYEQLKDYDTTGVCAEIEDEEDKQKMVAIETSDENGNYHFLFVYGYDGFVVYTEE